MSISMIAAIGKNNELGKNNDLIWHFHDDMVFFRKTTTGGTVIMGRKTFESLPKLLPKRRNIIITSNKELKIDGAETVNSVKEALEISENDNVFIIGGGKIYSEFLKYADKLYLTEVEAECAEADTYFPVFNKNDYRRKIIASYKESGIAFSHVLYEKL